MIKIENIKLNPDYSERDLKIQISKKINIKTNDILEYEYIKKSIDARRKPNVYYIVSVVVKLKDETKFANLKYENDLSGLIYEKKVIESRPIVVGFGPSGMFVSLALAKMGLNPIIIERGETVDARKKSVEKFWKEGILNENSNVQFGEGGAGTFSDGKLNTNLNSLYCKKVLNELYIAGAPKEILFQAKPHIGSDKLSNVVKNIREQIISLGGEFKFSTKLEDVVVQNNKVCEIVLNSLVDDKKYTLGVKYLFLCLGHSARDTFKMLYKYGLEIKQKPFAMGVRIEQKQEDINVSQYGENYNKSLPNADYKLVEHLENGRSVFTFCMCPGGEVVASSSESGTIVTNGMSYFARDKENANSAVLVNVEPKDFNSANPLAGLDFQEKYEKLAFELGGRNYNAPAQSVGSFLGKNIDTNIKHSYKPNITLCDVEKCLPDFVTNSLRLALPRFNNKLKYFAKDENLLIGIESRSSCPLTILRDENFESSIKGVYPVGEGAGYAGGIMSSAVDGIKCAEVFYNRL